MKGFCLDESGDVVIQNHDIVLTSGLTLKMQKIRQVLGTNYGEWWLDEKEGIPRQKVLKKNPDQGQIRDFIRKAIRQVDPDLQMVSCQFQQTADRKFLINFVVSDGNTSGTVAMEV
ncbi:MAG: hypothetical protein Q4C66_15210 [Lachnospiraceae bacterium]|nr:hypothetical protein [Lachnospiraceae bacterium]